MTNKILIEMSEEDRIFVENVCAQTYQNFTDFFKYMLSEYRKKHHFEKDCKNADFRSKQNNKVDDQLQQIEQEHQRFSEEIEENDKMEDTQESDKILIKNKKNKK